MIFDNNEINKFILQNNVIEHNSILFKYNNTLVVGKDKLSNNCSEEICSIYDDFGYFMSAQ